MTPRRKRIAFVLVGVVSIAVATAFILNAFKSNLVFFFSPSDVLEGKAPSQSVFRIGGLVEVGSVERQADGLTVVFKVTDLSQRIEVEYTGILPDLFSEGQGVVAEGRLGTGNRFIASRVLAKHDENYMPPEVAESLAGHADKLERKQTEERHDSLVED